MKKMLGAATIAAVTLIGSVTTASAITTADATNFNISGNDTGMGVINADLLSWVDGLGLDSGTMVQVAKTDAPSGGSGGMTVTYDGGAPSNSGTWTYTSPVQVVVYKAGSEFSAFYYAAGIASDMWDTATANLLGGGGNGRDISHISLFTVSGGGGGGPTPVPVPAGFLLLGTALAGLGFARRKS